MKKIIIIFILLFSLISLSGCFNDNNDNTYTKNEIDTLFAKSNSADRLLEYYSSFNKIEHATIVEIDNNIYLIQTDDGTNYILKDSVTAYSLDDELYVVIFYNNNYVKLWSDIEDE